MECPLIIPSFPVYGKKKRAQLFYFGFNSLVPGPRTRRPSLATRLRPFTLRPSAGQRRSSDCAGTCGPDGMGPKDLFLVSLETLMCVCCFCVGCCLFVCFCCCCFFSIFFYDCSVFGVLFVLVRVASCWGLPNLPLDLDIQGQITFLGPLKNDCQAGETKRSKGRL